MTIGIWSKKIRLTDKMGKISQKQFDEIIAILKSML
jgi:hypothetical protein